jgi:hypothetical protein
MKVFWIIIVMLTGTATLTKAQSTEIQQLLLNYEKLNQLKNILSDMKKGYNILSKGYTTIKDISKGYFSLHEAFIDGLMAVNPAIKNYKRVGDIISYQKNIVREYKAAFLRFRQSGEFSPNEIEYLGKVYGKLFNKSIQSLDELATVITSSKLSMSDDERLQAIDRIFADTQDKLQFLRDFNKKANFLAIQRSREKQDVAAMEQLYQGNQ